MHSREHPYMATGIPGSAYQMTGARLAVKRIFRDVASGAVDSRKGLAEAIEYVREGDILIVWKLDRLGRPLKHLIETVKRPWK